MKYDFIKICNILFYKYSRSNRIDTLLFLALLNIIHIRFVLQSSKQRFTFFIIIFFFEDKNNLLIFILFNLI